jgi:hypothetical protein
VNPDVFVIFWGSAWQTDTEHLNAKAALLGMYQQIGTSGYACAWREYGVTGSALGPGTFNGSEVIPTAPPSPLSDAAIQQQIVTEVTAGRAPAVTDDRVYVVVPPRGVPVDSGGVTGCGGSNFVFCGYHDSFLHGGSPFRYAVLPFPCNAFGFTCFVDPTDDAGRALQVVGSHELTELVTDPDAPPVGFGGWFNDAHGSENADICAANPCIADLTVGAQTFAVNSTWSNLANGCVAAVPCAPPAPIACTESAPGLCVPGAGNPACGFEWLVYPNLTKLRGGVPAKTVTCTDGQPFCDLDGVQDGKCTFQVAGCLNSDDPRIACTPAPISSINVMRPQASSTDPTDAANAATLLAALKDVDGGSTGTQTGSQITYVPAASTHNACTGMVSVTVPLRTLGTRTLRGTKRLSLKSQTEAGPVRDRLTLVCKPSTP